MLESQMLGSQVLEPKGLTDPSLVLDLPLYDLDGSSFKSRDRFGHLCTVTGATWGLQGRTFGGIDDYIQVPHHDSQLLITGGSIGAWIKANTIGETTGRIVDKSTGNYGENGFVFCMNDQYVQFWISGGNFKGTAAGSVPFGSWSHVAATWDATGYVYMYVNGVASGTPGLSADPVIITTTNVMRIGQQSTATGRTFDGVIGEVRIYSRVLTLAEIQNNFLSTKWRFQ